MKFFMILLFIFTLPLFSYEFNIENVLKKMDWNNFSADMQLALKRGKKENLIKRMHIKAISNDEGQKILAMFTFPSNMKGMAFLAYCNKNLEDKRYIYLRTLRRVKKVPANADNFMLRDFLSLYLLKPRTELWNYKKLSENKDNFVIEATAKSDKTIEITGYKKLNLTIDKKKNIIIKTKFYGKNNNLRRTQKVLETKAINNIIFITKMETYDKDEDVKAEITLKNIKIQEISNKIFTIRYLKSL